MATANFQYFSFSEVCGMTELSTHTIEDMVEYGVIEPVGTDPHDWQFNTEMIVLAKKANRLHEDLDIDWPGIALAISLLDELDRIREENQQLHRLLDRFIAR